jgi:hypothetical protein
MKYLFLFAALVSAAERPELAGIKTVYLLPMSSSLDQFLAVRLTKGGVVQVVTDPKTADAVLSDTIGRGLEDKLNELYGEKKKDDSQGSVQSFAGPITGAGRSKGAVFLIDRKTRGVIWSEYVRPKDAQPPELNRVANKIAESLEKEKKGQ